MTSLDHLRRQLARLLQARNTVRGFAAWSAAGTALVWVLVAILVIDLWLEPPALPRLVLLVCGAAAVVWAIRRYTLPLWNERESLEEMALLVDRRHKLDSDLIAALQFESPAAREWGSRKLSGAVIDYVAAASSSLDVFDGFSTVQLWRRGVLCGGSLLLALLAAACFPGHAAAFLQRLCLGGVHYPTQTVLEQIVLNQDEVLTRARHGSQPTSAKAAQARPVDFFIRTSGVIPRPESKPTVQVVSAGDHYVRSKLDLVRLTREQRVQRLTDAVKQIQASLADDGVDISTPWRRQVASFIRLESPALASELEKLTARDGLGPLAEQVATLSAQLAQADEPGAVYSAQIARLGDSVRYQVYLGDAWTDPAHVAMIPLPAVEPQLKITPPAYAAQSEQAGEAGARQFAVLEGSAVELSLSCVNHKPLASAWAILKSTKDAKPTVERFELRATDDKRLAWTFSATASPLAQITGDLQYEIQVLDEDNLSLEHPIRGAIRIKPDRPPLGALEVVHKVVLPSAEPTLTYHASDDYGVAAIRLIVDVERKAGDSPSAARPAVAETGKSSATAPAPGGEAAPSEQKTLVIRGGEPLRGAALPLVGEYKLALAPFSLLKGDRVKLTLEIVDYRGENSAGEPLGKAYQAEPLVLEISDESGVLAAISEADARSEQRLTDLIKRQLGIGESP